MTLNKSGVAHQKIFIFFSKLFCVISILSKTRQEKIKKCPYEKHLNQRFSLIIHISQKIVQEFTNNLFPIHHRKIKESDRQTVSPLLFSQCQCKREIVSLSTHKSFILEAFNVSSPAVNQLVSQSVF